MIIWGAPSHPNGPPLKQVVGSSLEVTTLDLAGLSMQRLMNHYDQVIDHHKQHPL